MDENSETIDNFESILKKQTSTRSSSLYNTNTNQNSFDKIYNEHVNAQIVLTNVSKQIKAMQNSDIVRSNRKMEINLEKCKKSSFLPLNKLQEQVLPQPPAPSRFETQLISDSQLISIAENAETLDVDIGMTQEFETTFYNGINNGTDFNQNSQQINESFPILDITLKEPDPNITLQLNNEENENSDDTIGSDSPDLLAGINIQITNDTQSNEVLNECIDIQDIDELEVKTQDNIQVTEVMLTQRPASPVFNIKSKKNRYDNPSPLVYDLDVFENFEKIAIPVVEQTKDNEKARFLINSQIIDKELLLQTSIDDPEPLSPIIEINDDLIEIKKELVALHGKELSSKHNKEVIIGEKVNNKDIEDKNSSMTDNFIKDEILFSSDEEGFENESYNDLPFTCALETSFYDHSEALDKTMYVGFQTASNKSIQIGTDSFYKAKSLLDTVEKNLKNEATLTKLVELCESNRINSGLVKVNEVASNTDTIPEVYTKDNLEKQIDIGKTGIEVPTKDLNSTEHMHKEKDKVLLEASMPAVFKTASDKSIPITEKALEMSSKIFRNIDLEENFELQVETPKRSKRYDRKLSNTITSLSNLCKNALSADNIAKHNVVVEENIDDDVIREFQEDLMQTEFDDIFKDIENDNKIDRNFNQINDVPKVAGFKTASNKYIHVSDAAVAKSKKLFQDIDSTEESNIKINERESSPFKKDLELKSDTIGFKTASNKQINVSEKALAKTRTIFKDIDLIDDDVDFDVSDKNGTYSSSKFLQVKNMENINNDNHVTNKNNIETNNAENKASELQKSNGNYEKFIGFKTASNKHINVSAQALTKSITLFADTEKDGEEKEGCNSEENDEKEPPFYGFKQNDEYIDLVKETLERSQKIFEKLTSSKTNVTSSEGTKINESKNKADLNFDVGFKTASNKKVKISDVALAKSRKIFQDINEDKQLLTNTENEIIQENTNSRFKIEGFCTASNNEFKIFKTALAKSKQKFQDINDDQSVKINISHGNAIFKGFQTANKKEVKISKEALEKSKKLFQDIDDVDINLATKPLFEGFQTASNKKVLVSEKSLERSRKIFQEISEINLNANDFDERTGKVNSEFRCFQTASNKKANISEDALAKSRKLLNEPYQEFEEKCSGYLNAYKGNTNTEFKGFQTASNKTVKISKAALERSRKIFQDIAEDNAIETDVGNIDTNKVNVAFKGFQTASNKEVKVSAEALAKSKRMLQDIDEDSFGTLNMGNCSTEDANILPKFTGFQTASNKEVKVSSEAMAKSKKMFQDINDSEFVETETSKHIADSNFKGFQTASNKEVIISEKAIGSSKKILEDIESKSLNVDPREIKANTDLKFSGFQTANNKNVKISEEALVKSRKIFQDLDLDIDRSSTETCNNEKSKEVDIKVANKKTDVYALPRHVTENIDKDTKISKSKLEINKYNDIIDDVDTQLLNNFEQSMHETTPKKSKRSGSPILSCPKAKRRKIFQIPYSQKSPKKTCDFIPPAVYHKPENMYNFNLTYKKAKMYTLKDLQKLETMKTVENNIDPYILNFNFDNIHQFEFTDSRNDITNTVLTLTELKNIFINSVNKKLIPDGWIDIQMKLILWKLMSYELKFPKNMSFTCTAKNVMDQLKYRFDKELYNAERPALRKILERDDTPAKTIILCVAAICDTQDTSQLPELILTDGWYTIKTVIDKMLSKLVNNGKITIGTKLVIHGAELVGSEQAVSPWEDTSSLRLKIFGNSTRRARWDARLGYHGNGAILSQLSTVALDGGKVSKLRVLIARVYPALYVDKFEDGSTVTRSERLEHIHQMKFETETQALLEKIYEEVEKEVLDQDSQGSEGTSSGSKRKTLESGSQIAKVMKRSRDPAEFRSHLTSTQTALLEDHTTREREILLQEIQTRVQNKMAALGVTLNRNVVTLLKVRVAGFNEKSNVEVTRALLSIWRPNEAVVEMIKEGTWIEILNVVPTALRYSELQISAGRQSIFIQSKYKESEKVQPYTTSLKRTCYPIKDLVKNPAMTTDYNEIDTAGIVIEIDPEIDNFDVKKHQFQNVYLADADKNIISVNFWGGLKKFGFENVLDTGQIVAGINLQKRAGNTRKNIPQYRVTEYSYFTKTPKSDTARKIIEELAQKLHKINKKVFYQECNTIKSNFSTRQTNENVTPYRFPNVDMNLSKNKIFLDSPLPQNILKKDDNLNLTGLDFESTFNQTNMDQLSPRTLLRKQQVKERIAKLKRYGEPPPLSPIQMINKSKYAANAYKSPLISKSDVSPSVASSEKKLRIKEKIDKDLGDAEIQCSPVISLNRTYVKRSNPVKLNFSKNDNSISETVDEFAEEFDSSPPLSLD